MPVPANLRDHFSNGRINLSETTALMNPYAKWMQSPNIPRISKVPIMLDEFETIKESDPSIDDWIFKLKNETSKQEIPIPSFFPESYKISKFYTNIYKCPERFIYALLSAHDSCFPLYSDACKREAVFKLITEVSLNFYDIYDVNVYRLYKKTKPQIYKSLTKSPGVPELHVISEVLNVNILIMRQYNYEWASFYNIERPTYCLWVNGTDVGAIRDSKNGGNIDVQCILNEKLDINPSRTRLIELNRDEETRETIKELRTYNVIELKEYAKERNIGIFDENGLPLKKEILFNNVIESI